ncbi:MAG TPA: hypothetical protein VFZ61_04790, partial [Polyangiales bacterium]
MYAITSALMRIVVGLAWVCALPSRGAAQPPVRPALHWSRAPEAESCIGPHALALRVTALTGPVLVEPTTAELSIEGHILRLPDGQFEARLNATTRDGAQRGARSLKQAGDCRQLDDALTLVIALMIDPDLALERLPASVIALGAEGQPAERALLDELDAAPAPSP